MPVLVWKKDYGKILRKLKDSLTAKRTHGWSESSKPFFKQEDILKIKLDDDEYIHVQFTHSDRKYNTIDLNMQETEIIIKWIEHLRKIIENPELLDILN